MLLTIYNAGPEVFLSNAPEIFRRKSEICARHGLLARSPLDTAVDPAAPGASLRIYRQNRR